MGDAIQNAMNTEYYNQLIAMTHRLIINEGKVYDYIFGTNPSYGDQGISATLALMLRNRKNFGGGYELQATLRDRLSQFGGFMNPYGTYPIGRTPKRRSIKWDWAYQTIPMPRFEADELLNAEPSQALDLMKDELIASYQKLGVNLAQAVYSDGVTVWDAIDTNPAASVATAYPVNAPKPNGFGYNNSSSDNAILGTANSYAGIDRADGDNWRFRPFIVASTALPSGAVAVTDLTWGDLNYVWNRARVGALKTDTAVMGQTAFDHYWELAEQQRIITDKNIDGELLNIGFTNFKINGKLTIVCDPDFCPPQEITFYNKNMFHLSFRKGQEPYQSQAQWVVGEGYGQMYSELRCMLQFIALFPSLFGRIYGFTV